MTDQWNHRRDVVDGAWASAKQLSLDAGHNFNDRSGVRQQLETESIMDRAVRKYLAVTTWPEITLSIRPYGGRPEARKRGGGKQAQAPQPTYTRRS